MQRQSTGSFAPAILTYKGIPTVQLKQLSNHFMYLKNSGQVTQITPPKGLGDSAPRLAIVTLDPTFAQ